MDHSTYAPKNIREGVDNLKELEKRLSNPKLLSEPPEPPSQPIFMEVNYNGDSLYGKCTALTRSEATKFINAFTALRELLLEE